MSNKIAKPVKTTKTAFLSFIRPVTIETVNALLSVVNDVIKQGATEIILLMSSPGGNLLSGFAAYNQLSLLPVTLTTYNIGSINSVAIIMFLAGEKRFAVPTATFLFHETNWSFTQSTEIPRRQIIEAASALDSYEKNMRDIIVSKTSLTASEVNDLLLAYLTRDAHFAKDRKIIDDIVMIDISPGVQIIQV